MVREGGLLVVMTCSIEREENEEVVARFLEEQPAFEPENLAGSLSGRVRTHLETPHLWRVLPGGDHDGFSVQVLRRTALGRASRN